MSGEKNIKNGKDRKLECNNCDRDFQSKKTLNNHNERIHKQVIDNKKDDTTFTVTSDNNVENIDNNRTNDEVQNRTIIRMSIEDEEAIMEEIAQEMEMLEEIQVNTTESNINENWDKY